MRPSKPNVPHNLDDQFVDAQLLALHRRFNVLWQIGFIVKIVHALASFGTLIGSNDSVNFQFGLTLYINSIACLFFPVNDKPRNLSMEFLNFDLQFLWTRVR